MNIVMPHAEEIAGQQTSSALIVSDHNDWHTGDNRRLLKVWTDDPGGTQNVPRLEVGTGAQIKDANFALTGHRHQLTRFNDR